MAEERKMKSSLFGYSKKSVDDAIEAINTENSRKISELNTKLDMNNKTNAMLQMENKMLRESKKQLEAEFEAHKVQLDEILGETENLKKLNAEQQQKLDEVDEIISKKDRLISSVQSEHDKLDAEYTGVLATFNNLKADLTRSRIVIDEKNKQIEELTSKLNKSEILHREFIKASKELSTNMISSGGTFDKKLTDLRECTDQMKTLCAEAEFVFNEIYMNISNFIISSSENNFLAENKAEAPSVKLSSDDQHIS
mgnify:FL=1